MKHQLPACLALVAAAIVVGCAPEQKKEEPKVETSPEPVRVPIRCEKRIDGLADDWAGDEPLWEEGGSPVADPIFNVDIKQVYVTNDVSDIYVFLRCEPSVQDRFKKQPLPVKLGDLFWDVDGDGKTGTTEGDLQIFGYGRGYELRLSIDIGVGACETGAVAPFVSYEISALDREGVEAALARIQEAADATSVVWRQIVRRALLWRAIEGGQGVSTNARPSIAYGNDGIEMSLPLRRLKLEHCTGIRVLLGEEAQNFGIDGYSVRYYTVQ